MQFLPRRWLILMGAVTIWLIVAIGVTALQIGRPFPGARTTPTLWVDAHDYGRQSTAGPFFDRVVALDNVSVHAEADWWRACEAAFRNHRPLIVTILQPDGNTRIEHLTVKPFDWPTLGRLAWPYLLIAIVFCLTGWIALSAVPFGESAKAYVLVAACTTVYGSVLADWTLFHQTGLLGYAVFGLTWLASVRLACRFPQNLTLSRYLEPVLTVATVLVSLLPMAVYLRAGSVPWSETARLHGLTLQVLFGWGAILQLVTVGLYAVQFRRSPPDRRRPPFLVLSVSIVSALAIALLGMLPVAGVLPFVAVAVENPLLLSLAVPLTVAYIIGRHGYWNVGIRVRRAIVWSLAIGLLACLYASCLALAENLLPPTATKTLAWMEFLSGLLVAALFEPLRRLIDRWLFASRFDAEGLLRDLGERLATVTDPDEVARLCLEILEAGPHPTSGRFQVTSADQLYLASSFGEMADSPPAVALPLESRGNYLGRILLGNRRSERPYSQQDLAFIAAVAHQAALALDRALLFEQQQLALTQSEKSRREAESALQTRDNFLSAASHELRTPLTALKLQIEMLRRHAVPDSVHLSRLTACNRQLDRLVHLVNDLLDVSLLGEGRLGIEPEQLPLNEVLAELVEDYQFQALAAGCPLHADLDRVTGVVDRRHLEQVVSNLVSNALKYGAGKPVTIGLSAEDDHARITVSDQGIGIAAADLDKLFQRFGRLSSARNYSGLGLGLWITRNLVEQCGGSIQVESTPGQRTVFTVQLPLASSSYRGSQQHDEP